MDRDFLAQNAAVLRAFEMRHWSRMMQKDVSHLMQWCDKSAAQIDRELVGLFFFVTEVK